MIMKVVKSDGNMFQLLTQLQSQHEFGTGNGSDGGGDDEDVVEDVEDKEDEDIDQGRCEKWGMKVTKKVANPRCLSYSIHNPVVFSLSTKTRQHVLAFGGPRQEVVTKKNTTFGGRGTSTQVLLSMRALYSSHIACFQLGSRRAWKKDLGIGEEVVTCKLYLGLAFIIPTLERVTIGYYEVGGGGVVGGIGVVCGDGVDSGVRVVDCGVVYGFVCRVKEPVFAMIVRVPEKDRWCGTRDKFVRWKGVRARRHPGGQDVDAKGNIYWETIWIKINEAFIIGGEFSYLNKVFNDIGCDKNISKVEGTIWIGDLYMTIVGDKFETYVKAKDLDLWSIILNDDFPPVAKNEVTHILEVVPFEKQSDDLKKKLAKNNEAKMVLYNALPKRNTKEFLCVKRLKIFGNQESIDSGFARFNTIITSLKALNKSFSSKNYVRKLFRTPYPKWRAKITAIEESKDLSSLALDELIGNLKVHEVVMKKDSELYKGKKERIKQPREKKKSFRQRDEKKGKSDRKCFRCGDPNHLIGDCQKPSRNKDQKAFIEGSWSDSENDAEDKTNDETCLMARSSNEETQVKFDKSVNSLREMLNNQKSPSCKVGLGFDSSKASTSRTEIMSFVESSAEKAMDGSTIKVHGFTMPGFVSRTNNEIVAEHVFSPPMSSRSDFVITRKKLIHNRIDESKKSSLKPSPKSGIGYVCLRTCLEPDDWIKDSGCSKHMTGNESLFSTYKAYDEGNVVFGSNLKGKIIGK
nr:hypothetical protein [Tanacetum cinerariifolium]